MGSSQKSSTTEKPNEIPVIIQSTNISRAIKRVENERKQILKNPPTHWKLITGSQWNVWHIWITAPITCPYHTTPFQVIVRFSENYPNELPRYQLVNFQRFFHPNISPTSGQICQQTLKKKDITLSLRSRIDAFVSVLSIPNPKSALNDNAAALYASDPRAYYRKAFVIFNGK